MINESFDEYKNSINSVLKNVSSNQLKETIKIIKKTIKKKGKVYVIGNGGNVGRR